MSNRRKLKNSKPVLDHDHDGNPIRHHVRKILHAFETEDQKRDTEIARLEADGYRIVTGGQTGPKTWEITDWSTGELIGRGDDGLDGYEAATKRLSAGSRWRHIDRINEGDDGLPPLPEASPTAGVPPTLAELLWDWVSAIGTPYEEIAEIVEWDVSEVKRRLEHDRR